MKISKCKKELARIISENGGWREGAEFFVSTCNGIIIGSSSKPKYTSKYGWISTGGFIDDRIELCSYLKNWHQTILSRAEYFFLYQEQGLEDALNEDFPDSDGWIEWKGGECPVENGTLVDVIWRDGTERAGVKALHIGGAGYKFWVADGMANDIIAYRLHKPEVKPEFCESVMRSIPEPESHEKLSPEAIEDAKFALMSESIEESKRKPTIEQLADDYRNAKDSADRKQQEADDAKAAADAALAELVAAGKAIDLVIGIATPEPELVITDWRDLLERDVIWFGGDDEQSAGEYSVLEVENPSYGGNRAIRIDTIGDYYWIDVTDDWKFIRRP